MLVGMLESYLIVGFVLNLICIAPRLLREPEMQLRTRADVVYTALAIIAALPFWPFICWRSASALFDPREDGD